MTLGTNVNCSHTSSAGDGGDDGRANRANTRKYLQIAKIVKKLIKSRGHCSRACVAVVAGKPGYGRIYTKEFYSYPNATINRS